MPEAAPVENNDEEDEGESDEEEYEDTSPSRNGTYEWVYEDGQIPASLDESDSSLDSLDADQSLDIVSTDSLCLDLTDNVQPGQGVISFSPQALQTAVMPEDGEQEELSVEYDNEVADQEEVEVEAEDEASCEDGNALLMESEGVYEEEEEVEEDEGEHVQVNDDEEGPEGTPVMVSGFRPITHNPYQCANLQQRSLDRFYTPQPHRSVVANAPRTLSSIGGPAVRFQRMPETPSAGIRRVAPTPGSLGAPSRRITQPVVHDESEDEASVGPSTPVKRDVDPAVLEEVSHGTIQHKSKGPC